MFKLHCGKLTLKIYTKGARVLRIEVVVHNTEELRCGRSLEKFPEIVVHAKDILERFMDVLSCIDQCFIADSCSSNSRLHRGSVKQKSVFAVCGNLRQSLSFYKEATGAAAPPVGLFIQSVEVPPVSPSSSCSIPTATSSRSTARRSSRKPVLKCSPKMVRISFDYTNQLVYMFS